MPSEFVSNIQHENKHFSADLGEGGLEDYPLPLGLFDVSATNVSLGSANTGSINVPAIVFDAATTAQVAVANWSIPGQYAEAQDADKPTQTGLGDLGLIVRARLYDAGTQTASGEGLQLIVGLRGADGAGRLLTAIEGVDLATEEVDMDAHEATAATATDPDKWRTIGFNISAVAEAVNNAPGQLLRAGANLQLRLGPKKNLAGTLQIEVEAAWIRLLRHVSLHAREDRFKTVPVAP